MCGAVCPGAEQKIVADWQSQRPQEPVHNSLVQASGKLVLIDKLLPKLKQSGHKVNSTAWTAEWSRAYLYACVPALSCPVHASYMYIHVHTYLTIWPLFVFSIILYTYTCTCTSIYMYNILCHCSHYTCIITLTIILCTENKYYSARTEKEREKQDIHVHV